LTGSLAFAETISSIGFEPGRFMKSLEMKPFGSMDEVNVLGQTALKTTDEGSSDMSQCQACGDAIKYCRTCGEKARLLREAPMF